MSTNGFTQHCRDIARRFLLTAVVVDDELSVSAATPVHGDLTRPGRGAGQRARTAVDLDPHRPRPLRVLPITRSFAGEGMVCGVVSPQEGENDHEALANVVARADIVILDWLLNQETGANALPLLERILANDPRHQLRLIAFYTDEQDHEGIRDQVTASLNSLSALDRAVYTSDEHRRAIDFRECRIVVYGKPGSRVLDPSTIVKEEDLANRLIADFADMVEGLLPSLALTALTAVRENVYRVLERFGPDLDPAFLAHRACLPQPPESEQHMVEQIASELHGIMDDAVGRTSPAGIDVIRLWLQSRFGDDEVIFSPKHKAPVHVVQNMLKDGLKKQPGPIGLSNYILLSHGFSGGMDNSRELDRRLASAMSIRQVYGETSRQLTMGTVVRRIGEDDAMLICVTPSCDSVRLTEQSSFLFLPLLEAQENTLQVVVPSGDEEHQRMTVSLKPSQWCIRDFRPDPDRECVLAHSSGPDQPFVFRDVGGGEYRWVGELKAESAQSIAQSIAERMSRMPLNKSEWLRRSERFGKRAG